MIELRFFKGAALDDPGASQELPSKATTANTTITWNRLR